MLKIQLKAGGDFYRMKGKPVVRKYVYGHVRCESRWYEYNISTELSQKIRLKAGCDFYGVKGKLVVRKYVPIWSC
jgi:hypothetical protein